MILKELWGGVCEIFDSKGFRSGSGGRAEKAWSRGTAEDADRRASGVNPPLQLAAGGDVGTGTGREKRAGLGGANSLASAGFGEDDMPEIVLRGGEAETDEAAILFFADRSDDAVDGVGSHFVEELDPLAGKQRRVHDDQSAVTADELGERLQVDGFAFGHLAAHREWNLKRDAYGATPFGISGPMHE